jgi:hypothetical protein
LSVGPIVIDAGFSREGNCLIPATAIWKRVETLDARNNFGTKFDGLVSRIVMIKKIKNRPRLRQY